MFFNISGESQNVDSEQISKMITENIYFLSCAFIQSDWSAFNYEGETLKLQEPGK